MTTDPLIKSLEDAIVEWLDDNSPIARQIDRDFTPKHLLTEQGKSDVEVTLINSIWRDWNGGRMYADG